MPGHLIDLSRPGAALPRRIAVDSSLLIARWLSTTRPPLLHQAAQATAFFRLLQTSGATGLIPSISLHETLHIALATQYRLALPTYQAELAAALPRKRRFDWNDLYKVRPDLILRFRPALTGLHSFLVQYNLVVLQPPDLGPISAGRSLEETLLELLFRYQLDTSDAAILLEAQRAGVMSIATLDADLRRAASDFDVYTWL